MASLPSGAEPALWGVQTAPLQQAEGAHSDGLPLDKTAHYQPVRETSLELSAEIWEQGQMPIGRSICMHATANEKASVLVSEPVCLLLTQVKTRDATATKNGKLNILLEII